MKDSLKPTSLEFQMYIDYCIMKDENGKKIMLHEPTGKGLNEYVKALREMLKSK